MTKVFTASIIAEIVRRARAGATGKAIAERLGLKEASLRVKCSKLGISLRKCREAQAALDDELLVFAEDRVSATTTLVSSYASVRPGEATLSPAMRPAPAPLIIDVPHHTTMQFRQWAASRGMSAERLASQMLTLIAQEDLFNAILDDAEN
jgi:hypothetical protein